MDKKKRVITALLMLLVTAVIWGILYAGDQNKPTFDTAFDKYKALEQITYLKVSNGERTHVLVWDGKFWMWEDNQNLAAPQDEVKKRIQNIMEKTSPKKVEEDLLPEDVGLKEAEYELTLKDAKGNQLVIRIGEGSPSGAYYAQFDGEQQIYTIRKDAKLLIEEIIVFRMMLDYDINSSPSLTVPR